MHFIFNDKPGFMRIKNISILFGFAIGAIFSPIFSEDTRLVEDGLPADEPDDVKIFYERGFSLEGFGNKVKIGGYLEFDERYFTNNKYGDSQFLLRRARFFITGEVLDLFGYMLMPRWDYTVASIEQAWIETRFPTPFQIRLGFLDYQFGKEHHISLHWFDFNERTVMAFNFIPTQDFGGRIQGKLGEDYFEYFFGIYNGNGRTFAPEGGAEVMGQGTVWPFRGTCSIFEDLGIGCSFSRRYMSANLSDEIYQTPSMTAFFQWNDDIHEHGHRTRIGGDFEWFIGSGSVVGEYIHQDLGRVTNGLTTIPFATNSWYIAGTYLLTGEPKVPYKPVIPCRNFDFHGGWGAFEVVARYEVLNMSKEIIDPDFGTGSRALNGITTGLNWYINPQVAIKTDWQLFNFKEKFRVNSHYVRRESVVITRFQIEF